MATKASKWEQIGREAFEEQGAGGEGRHLWVSDGYLGFSRPLGEGETVEEALTEFASAYDNPEGAVECWRLYEGGEQVS